MPLKNSPIRACHLPWEWLAIGPNGDTQPCCWASDSVGNLREQTLDEIWNGPKMVRLRRSIVSGHIDGVCRGAGCRFVAETERALGSEAYDYTVGLGETVGVSSNGRSAFCTYGWSKQETWGIWANAIRFGFRVDVPAAETDFKLHMLCRGIFDPEGGGTDICVSVNQSEPISWSFSGPEETFHSVWRTIHVPADLIDITGRIELEFQASKLASPSAFGRPDTRMLAMAVSAVLLEIADNRSTDN